MREEIAPLHSIAKFIHQVVKSGDHIRALEAMDLSDDAFWDDLHLSGIMGLLPEIEGTLQGGEKEK